MHTVIFTNCGRNNARVIETYISMEFMIKDTVFVPRCLLFLEVL